MDTYDKKRKGLIISYYLSRCNKEAVSALGYDSFREAFIGIGALLQDKPNNIKNMRDEFDPYFDNGRRGWYQRELKGSRKEVFDAWKDKSDEELKKYVKTMVDELRKPFGKTERLCDLSALIRQTSIHYNKDFVWQEVRLSENFKSAFAGYLEKNGANIQYFESTSIITTRTCKNIYVPNQWFVIAAYAVGVYMELSTYKSYFDALCNAMNEKPDFFARKLRDKTEEVDKAVFLNFGRKLLLNDGETEKNAGNGAERLWRFVTDYAWWSGQKTVDRADFYVSVVLNMLNLVNASQGYVADIVNAYGSENRLTELTRDLASFTQNLSGKTYDILIRDETTNDKEILYEPQPSQDEIKVMNRISISADSIRKLRGK